MDRSRQQPAAHAGLQRPHQLRGIDLPLDVLEKVMSKNFEAFVSKDPKPLPKKA